MITKGTYKSVEKAFLLATLFYAAYVVVGVIAHPNWGMVLPQLFVPQMSFDMDYMLLLTAMVGTTIAPWMLFYLMSAINEKGIKPEEYQYTKIDVILGSCVTMIVAFFIIVSCAAVIHSNGLRVDTAGDAAKALVPLAGANAGLLFAFGLISASLFAAAILPLATAFQLTEAFGWERGVDKKISEAPQFYTIFTLAIVASVVVILIPNMPLIPIMVVSQAMNGVLLPIILIFMLILINNKRIMGNLVNSKRQNILTIACSVLLIAMSLFLFASVFIK